MHIFLTGGTGFVGRPTLQALTAAGHQVVAVSHRRANHDDTAGVAWHPIPSLDTRIDWSRLLAGADAVVHLAGVAHIIDGNDAALAARYRAINCDATLALARAAVAAGVKRFVFMSSIRVHGNAAGGTVFHESDACTPSDEYGRSKLAAEDGLRAIARESALQVVCLRPPLVYGPGVGANFLRLLRWVDRGVPLPLGAIGNRRSFVYVDNLVAAIALALTHPRAAGETFLVSDGEYLSTPELLHRMAKAMDRRARLIAMPPGLLHAALRMLGRASDYQRLCGDAALDSAKIRATLGFTPPYSLDEGLAATVRWYRRHQP